MKIQTMALFLLLMLTVALSATAQDKSNLGKSGQEVDEKKSKVPAGLDFYKGRRIAQTMHYTGAEWLIRDEREREERCSLLLANLGIKKGMTICDVGCGNGFHTLQMARLVGDKGQVYGVDIQPEMLKFMRERCEESGVENVVPVLGSVHNPRLPRATFDLILLVDVYHEFSHPEHMLKAMRQSLKKDGVIALVEYRMEDRKVPIKLLHKMSKEQIMKEYPTNGFKLVRDFDKLPWQHLLFFARDDSELKEIEVKEFEAKKDDDQR